MNESKRSQAEKIWAENKYLVLSKSHKIYLVIREYLKEDEISLYHLQDLIDSALALEESPKDILNAYLHIWGYFKNQANEKEKAEFFNALDAYKDGKAPHLAALEILKKLLEKYPNKYLENSNIFKLLDK